MGSIVVFTLGEKLERCELRGVYERAHALLARERPVLLRCEVAGLPADAVSADAIARVTLAARRCGCAIEVWGASSELWELLRLIGLDGALVR